MRIRLAAGASLLVLLTITTGCWDVKHVRDMNYVFAIGFDYENQIYRVYVQMIDFNSISKSENPSTGGVQPAWVGMGKGKTLDSAVEDLYRMSEKRLFWGEIGAIVFSERMIQKGVDPALDLLNRYRETRYRMWVFGTNVPIKDVFSQVPLFSSSPLDSFLHNPTSNYEQSSHIRPINLQQFIRQYSDPGSSVLVPVLSLEQGRWSKKAQQNPALVYGGVLVTANDRPAVFLPSGVLNGVRWMERETARSSVVVTKGKEAVAVLRVGRPSIRITVRTDEGSLVFDVRLKLKAGVTQLIEPVSIAYMKERTIELIRQEIRQTYEAALKQRADVYNLEQASYRRSNREWRTARSDRAGFPLTPKSLGRIEIRLSIEDTGKYSV